MTSEREQQIREQLGDALPKVLILDSVRSREDLIDALIPVVAALVAEAQLAELDAVDTWRTLQRDHDMSDDYWRGHARAHQDLNWWMVRRRVAIEHPAPPAAPAPPETPR